MPIGKLDHYSIRTLDIEASRRFYTEIMGFQVGYRPEFNFPGLWLYNDRPYPESYGVVHIIGVDLKNPGPQEYLRSRPGRILKARHGDIWRCRTGSPHASASTPQDAPRAHGATTRLHRCFYGPEQVTSIEYPAAEVQKAVTVDSDESLTPSRSDAGWNLRFQVWV